MKPLDFRPLRYTLRRLLYLIPWWLARRRLRVGIIALFMMNEGTRVGAYWMAVYDPAAQMHNGFFGVPASQVYHIAITLLVVLLLLSEER